MLHRYSMSKIYTEDSHLSRLTYDDPPRSQHVFLRKQKREKHERKPPPKTGH